MTNDKHSPGTAGVPPAMDSEAGGTPAVPGGPAIEVEHLKAGYDGDVVLNDISFSVSRGELL